MRYQPPFVYGAIPGAPGIHNADPNASFVNGNPTTGTEGSYIPCEGVEHTQREIMAQIAAAGLSPDHAVLTQLRQSIARSASGATWFACTGSANAYTFAAVAPYDVPTSPFAGQLVRFIPNHTNTGAATAVWAGVSRSIRTWDDQALPATTLLAGRPAEAFFDPLANGAAGALRLLPWVQALTVEDLRKVPAQHFSATWTQSIPHTTYTQITGYSIEASNLDDATFASGILTIGARTAGLWVAVHWTTHDTAGFQIGSQVRRNGAAISTSSSQQDNFGVGVNAVVSQNLVAGDELRFWSRQWNSSPATRSIEGRSMAIRIGA